MHAFLISLLAAAAVPQDKLPPANPLPPPTSEEGQVMAPVNALFDGLARRDPAIVLATMRPDATATAANEKPDGTRTLRRTAGPSSPPVSSPAPNATRNGLTTPRSRSTATSRWCGARYDFLIDGKVHHCGYRPFRPGPRQRPLEDRQHHLVERTTVGVAGAVTPRCPTAAAPSYGLAMRPAPNLPFRLPPPMGDTS